MSFTYEDPRTNARDRVRFLIGDTDARRPQLQDAEVSFCLDQSGGDAGSAAIMACLAIIAQLGRLCDQSVGSVSKSFSQLQANYKETLGNLRRSASSTGGRPIVGGTSRAASELPYHNRDYIQPMFRKRMMQGARGSAAGLPEGGTPGSLADRLREPGEEG